MGEMVVVGYGVLAILGIALVTVGVFRKNRVSLRTGIGLLVAGAGAWVFGPAGLGLGVLAFVFMGRRRHVP